MTLFEYVDGSYHRLRKGHWPVWYLLGAGERWCTSCAKGGFKAGFVPRRVVALPLH